MPPKQAAKKVMTKSTTLTQGEKKKLKNDNKAKANPEKAAAKKEKNDNKRERRYVFPKDSLLCIIYIMILTRTSIFYLFSPSHLLLSLLRYLQCRIWFRQETWVEETWTLLEYRFFDSVSDNDQRTQALLSSFYEETLQSVAIHLSHYIKLKQNNKQ
jgi:hypothetical protein